ncbi:MAG: tRNA (adenosine(37)-N6)-dimethylallyltransferase MiaA [Chromatiales bacterium]|nr:tRNA (adenosine(37)-N6)-dimethylallyltransferase MiaA [Chromatiales bacterium]
MNPGEARPPVVCLMGPTAAGKTDLALALHARLSVDLISVDSAQVFRGMDIGTAKPSVELRARVPHALIDICDPAEAYSAGRFRADATALIEASHAAGRLPLLVGGTMLYFRALERGLADLPEADPGLRAQLDREAAEQGWAALHARLATVDPASAERIHPNDPQRIQRALEVWQLTGEPLSALHARAGENAPFRLIKLVVPPADREQLSARIAERFDAMLAAGLVDEVAALRSRPDLNLQRPSMRAVGYRQVWRHLDGEFDWATMRDAAIIATRQYAKRQLTWLRSEPGVQPLNPAGDRLSEALKLLAATGCS